MPELTPADLLVKAASCCRAAWSCRDDPDISWWLLKRGDEAMSLYDMRTASLPQRVAAPVPRPSLFDRLAAIRLGPDALS